MIDSPMISNNTLFSEPHTLRAHEEKRGSSENANGISQKTSLMEFLREFQVLPTPIIRTLFNRLVEEISGMHSNESYHGDLNLENVSFDQEYKIYLSQAVHISDSFLDGVYVDLISLGEILFTLCCGALPYVSLEDERYLAILNGDLELFWAMNEEALGLGRRGVNLSKSGLKDLISIFLVGQLNSKHDLLQLFAHEWMKGATLTSVQAKSLLDEVRKKMQKMT